MICRASGMSFQERCYCMHDAMLLSTLCAIDSLHCTKCSVYMFAAWSRPVACIAGDTAVVDVCLQAPLR
jgi:hypothetical protein